MDFLPHPLSPNTTRFTPVFDTFDRVLCDATEAIWLDTSMGHMACDPALSGFSNEADRLWARCKIALGDLIGSSDTPLKYTHIARHMLDVVTSDGSNPRRDAHHLRSISDLAQDSLPRSRMRRQFSTAFDLMHGAVRTTNAITPANFPEAPEEYAITCTA